MSTCSQKPKTSDPQFYLPSCLSSPLLPFRLNFPDRGVCILCLYVHIFHPLLPHCISSIQTPGSYPSPPWRLSLLMSSRDPMWWSQCLSHCWHLKWLITSSCPVFFILSLGDPIQPRLTSWLTAPPPLTAPHHVSPLGCIHCHSSALSEWAPIWVWGQPSAPVLFSSIIIKHLVSVLVSAGCFHKIPWGLGS